MYVGNNTIVRMEGGPGPLAEGRLLLVILSLLDLLLLRRVSLRHGCKGVVNTIDLALHAACLLEAFSIQGL